MTIDTKLRSCIKNSIKKRKHEQKRKRKELEKEHEQKIKEIKAFFKYIPRHRIFEFDLSGTEMKELRFLNLEKTLFTGEIKMSFDQETFSIFRGTIKLQVESWSLDRVRMIHRNLPWFESELRRVYGCDNV